MELRHDACRNDSCDRPHRRWKSLSHEVNSDVRGAYEFKERRNKKRMNRNAGTR
jgi:hypothetical protein